MHVLLYVPDNQITENFLPNLWPFLLQSLTPQEHQVTIINGNVVRWTEEQMVAFLREQKVDLVGMGFMTRTAQKAYEVAAAIRSRTDIPVVMGGPHVTAVPDEPLGLTGHPRYADAVVAGEADDLWPAVLEDAASGCLKELYVAGTNGGYGAKPSLENYPGISWEQVDLRPFNLMRSVPGPIQRLLKAMSLPFEKAYLIPVESGRGCPYGCDFCWVTGFFGQEVRFRTNESVIRELLLLKSLAKRDKALVVAFFIDDNLAINRKRTKALLREMIRRDACVPWVGQISINLLEDEELVELIAASGGRFIFAGLESMEAANLKAAHKQFNRPARYKAVLENLARHDVYAITSFIIGMDEDRIGVGSRIAKELETWPPGLPVFGLLTPFPGTRLYERFQEEKRLVRPEHWLDFQPYVTTFEPKHLSASEAENEVRASWTGAYGPAAFRHTQKWMRNNKKPFFHGFMMFLARLVFRSIYFPQRTRWDWFKLLIRNSPTMLDVIRSGLHYSWKRRRSRKLATRATPDLNRSRNAGDVCAETKPPS